MRCESAFRPGGPAHDMQCCGASNLSLNYDELFPAKIPSEDGATRTKERRVGACTRRNRDDLLHKRNQRS